jgi:hypothetical protein
MLRSSIGTEACDFPSQRHSETSTPTSHVPVSVIGNYAPITKISPKSHSKHSGIVIF